VCSFASVDWLMTFFLIWPLPFVPTVWYWRYGKRPRLLPWGNRMSNTASLALSATYVCPQ